MFRRFLTGLVATVLAGIAPSAALAQQRAAVAFHLVDAKNHPVADAVISLTRLDAIADVPTPAASFAPIEIRQQHQEFIPYVTAVRTGASVVFPNRDTVQHHVYSLSKPKKFELPLYRPGQAETIVFDQRGVVTIGCNIHDWMLAYVVVLDTPWFAVTAANGDATLRDLAPGRYRVDVWHPRLAQILTREITLAVAKNPPVAISLSLKPDRRIRRTPDANGSSYR